MAALTDLGAAARPTCTARRHTENTYHRGTCTCATGQEALRVYRKRHREGRAEQRMVDPTGTVRGLQGLMADGYTAALLADATGIRPNHICDIVRGHRQRVHASTARAVAAAVDRLIDQPGPSTRTRARAARAGYLPLEAWTPETINDPAAEPYAAEVVVDEVAVERAIRAVRVGVPLPDGLSRAEAEAVVARLASAPYRLHDTAIANGMHRNNRWVRATREAAGVPQVVSAPGRKAA
jgi:hypothetical protein